MVIWMIVKGDKPCCKLGVEIRVGRLPSAERGLNACESCWTKRLFSCSILSSNIKHILELFLRSDSYCADDIFIMI